MRKLFLVGAVPAFLILAQAGFAGLPAPQINIDSQQEYARLRQASTAGQVVLTDLARTPNNRIPAVLTGILFAAERNPDASMQQLISFMYAFDSALSHPSDASLADPRDPDLLIPINLLTRVRFGIREAAQPGLRADFGLDILQALGLQDETRTQQAFQLAEFIGNQAVDLINSSELPVVLSYGFLGLDSSGKPNNLVPVLFAQYLRSNGIEPFPSEAVLQSHYPFIQAALDGLPPDAQALQQDKQNGFTGIKQNVYDQIDALLAKMSDDLGHLQGIDARQRQDYLNAFLNPPVEDVNLAREKRLADIEYFNQARAGMNIPLTIAGLSGDPSVTGEVAKGAQTAKTIAEGLSFLAVAFEDAKKSNILRGGGGVFMIVSTIAALADDTPTTEEIILQQIIEMRQQIDLLRSEMNARFDAIDSSLDAIFALLGNTQLQIQDIQADLFRLTSNLNKLQQNMYGALQDGFQQPFVQAINNGVGYRQRTGFDLPYLGAESYNSFENTFYSNAVNNAMDRLYAGPLDSEPIGLTFLNAADTLPNSDFGSNVNNLRRFPADPLAAFLPYPLYPVRVANPTVWELSANAYAQLARENPWYFASFWQNDPNRLASVFQAGQQARSALSNMVNPDVLVGLMGYHKERQAALDAAIDNRRQAILNQQNPQVPLADLWGGPLQPLDGYNVPTLSLPRSGASSDKWSSFSINGQIAQEHKVAQYLGVKSLSMVIAPAYVSRRTTWGAAPGVWWYNYYAKPFVRVYVYSSGELVGTYEATGSEIFLWTVFYVTDINAHWDDGYQKVKDNWTGGQNLRSKLSWTGNYFTAGFEARQAINDRLRQLQGTLYNAVIQDLQGSGDIADRGRELSGAKELLDAYISLGMPQSVHSSDLLRTLLRGNALRLDAQGVQDIFIDANLKLPSTKPTVSAVMGPRVDGLAEVLDLLQEANEGVPEWHPYIQWTLANLSDVAARAGSLANDDIYQTSQGTALQVPAAEGLLRNDAPAPIAAPPQVAWQVRAIFDSGSGPGGARPTAAGGTVSLSPDGQAGFTYTPPPGFWGTDTFTYVLRGEVEGTTSAPTFSNTATAYVRVVGQMAGARQKANGEAGAVSGVVTAVYPDFLYIQDPEVVNGLRVDTQAVPADQLFGLVPGATASALGTTGTNADGERTLYATAIISGGSGDVAPMGMTAASIGGGDLSFNPATGAGQEGISGGLGANNIGLLVRLTGRVTKMELEGHYITIHDGSLRPGGGAVVDDEGNPGVRVWLNGAPQPLEGDLVTVTGVVSCRRINGLLYPLLLLRSSEDIAAVQ